MTTLTQLWTLLSSDQKRSAVSLLALMLVSMVLETLSVGAVIPALAVMTQENLAERYQFAGPVLEAIGNPSRERLIVLGMLLMVCLYAVKSVFLGVLAWFQARLVAHIEADVSVRLYAGYLHQPYAFHLRRNSAQLLTYVGQVSQFAGVVTEGSKLFAESFVIAGIAALLLWVEPLGAVVVVGTLGVASWAFHGLTRRRILHWGEARLAHNESSIQQLQQGLGGVKEVQLLGREAEFVAQFRDHVIPFANANQHQTTLRALPKLWLELLAVGGLAALVAVMVAKGRPLDTLLPTVGLFAAAAFRLMPSANRVLGAVQGIRYLVPVVGTLYSEVQEVEPWTPRSSARPVHLASQITLKDIGFRYGGADQPALSGVNLTITRGQAVGFVGRSGSGKTTLIDIVLGLLRPDAGGVRVDGHDIWDNIRGWQDQIGYVPQSIFLTDESIRNNIAFGLPADTIDDAAVGRAVEAAQLGEFVSQLPSKLETVVGERGVRLSGGQRQRIGIARALYHDPDVLVLDEATSALDTTTEQDVMAAVRDLHGKKTILIVAHRLSTVDYCDRVFRLDQGCLVPGGTIEPGAPSALRLR